MKDKNCFTNSMVRKNELMIKIENLSLTSLTFNFNLTMTIFDNYHCLNVLLT